MRAGTEEHLHLQVVDYLRTQYPKVLWRTDMGGIRLTPGLRAKAKKLQGGRAWPDLFIAHPKWVNRVDCLIPVISSAGLFIELKKDGVKVFKKDGTLVSNPHYREQAEVLQQLRRRGYKAEFAIGFDAAKELIDNYLKT